MGILVDAVREQSAILETHISRRGTDEARHRVLFHELRHVKAQKLDPKRFGELPGRLGLADPGRPGKEIGANRLFAVAQPGATQLDGRCQGLKGRILPEHDRLQVGLELLEQLLVAAGHVAGRYAGDGCDHILDFTGADRLAAPRLRQKALCRTGLVDDVDGLVGKPPVIDILAGEVNRRPHGIVGEPNLVMRLETGLEPLHDLDGLLVRRFRNVDLLEPAGQGPVLFEILAVFLVRR